MEKIIISSDNFGGEVYALYGVGGELLSLEFGSAALSDVQKSWLKAHIPVNITTMGLAEIRACFEGAKSVRINKEACEVTFDLFWAAYGEKVNRLRCEKRWERLGKAERQRAYAGVKVYFRYLARNSWQNKANPDTYLMNKYWENEWK